jgi:hypothetical protein
VIIVTAVEVFFAFDEDVVEVSGSLLVVIVDDSR